MVQVIYGERPGTGTHWWDDHPTGTPEIHIWSVERHVHGNCTKILVHGEIKIAAGEIVYARELKLNTLEVLKLTPEIGRSAGGYGVDVGYIPSKWIYHKGEYDNWASIDVYDDASNWQGAETPGPIDGSIWLDFDAKGE